MSPLSSIKAIVGLIPINLHLQKLRSHSLPHNYILQSLMEPKYHCYLSSICYHSASFQSIKEN